MHPGWSYRFRILTIFTEGGLGKPEWAPLVYFGLGWEREGGERVICAQRRNRRRPDDTLQARRSLEKWR